MTMTQIQKLEMIASLYQQLRGKLTSQAAWASLASLTDTILMDGKRLMVSSQSDLIRAIKKHTSLISVLQPFLINYRGKCKCGHWQNDHEHPDRVGGEFLGGKCLGKWVSGFPEEHRNPCDKKCSAYDIELV
jgi:hypothetical protein